MEDKMSNIKVTKIGLLNFWLYDDEEFDFDGGNLILRGTNGSGKSVTMQSFIPLILDGNKSPDRLDPFGSKERKIEDYILGDGDLISKDEATSYLYMETYNEEKNQYITIGLGFHGRKGRPIDSWGFALKDGRRIRKDFYLYKDAVNKVPLTKTELKTRLGYLNEFVDTTKDYKAMVNRLLFNFPNLDMYDEFIKLLLQLRSNKLSREYKPTNLVNVLNSVLQPLSEEDLKPISVAIEQLNKYKEKMELLVKNSKSLNDFLKVYRNLNEAYLFDKAKKYKEFQDEYAIKDDNLKGLEKEYTDNKEIINAKMLEKLEVENKIAALTKSKEEIDSSDLKNNIDKLTNLEKEIEELNLSIKNLESQQEQKQDRKNNYKRQILDVEQKIYNYEKEIRQSINDLKILGEDSYFDELSIFLEDLQDNLKEVSFSYILGAVKKYREQVRLIISYFQEKENAIKASENIRESLENLVKEYQDIEKRLDNYAEKLKDSILSWEEEFVNVLNNNEVLKLNDVETKKIYELMNDYSSDNYDEAREIYVNTSRDIFNNIYKDNIDLENKVVNLQLKKEELQKEFDTLNNRKDVLLPNTKLEVDKELDDNGIRYITLYQCLEFKERITSQERINLEASLLDLGLLGAKIIRKQDISKLNNLNTGIIYLQKSTYKKNNILKYFDVKLEDESVVTKKEVEEILECISIYENDEIVINANGMAKMGVLNASLESDYRQEYIGYLKRKELKEAKLHDLEEEIISKAKQIDNLESIIEKNKLKQEKLKEESICFPINTKIKEIEKDIEQLNNKLEWNDERQRKLEKEIDKYDEEIKKIKDKINKSVGSYKIPLNLNSYQDVAIIMEKIDSCLRDLKDECSTYQNFLNEKNSFTNTLDEIEESLDSLKNSIDEKSNALEVKQKQRTTIENILGTSELTDLKEKLLKIEKELDENKNIKENLIRDISKLENSIENLDKNLVDKHTEMNVMKDKLAIFQDNFYLEYKLGYVMPLKDGEINIYDLAKEVLKVCQSRDIKTAENNFWLAYGKYRLDLADYSIKNIVIFDNYKDDLEDSYMEIYKDASRLDIESTYQGKKLNLFQLNDEINNSLEEFKELITVQDQKLFEDILLNTVGEKIRLRIKSSRDWVNKINNIMDKMQSNSALRFKLIWKSAPASNDNEIDTRELVKILEMSADMISQSDLTKLTEHFRSKIKRAEELYKDSYVTFYKIVEDILDYRTWFSFSLQYQRVGSDFKELTDKVFAKFSGGERAKSMYIPLFASVYAKLLMAKEDSLRIIALDEAFAGVDDDNIREMFGILRNLNLNFIINSQVLWGDYDTVDKLSICNLIRPQNSKAVGVERYRWNGKYKEIVLTRDF